MEQKYDNEEMEIDLKEVFAELLEHWKLLALSTVMVAIIAFIISKFMITPQYESTATLYIMKKGNSITSLTDLQISSNLTADYQLAVSSRPVLEQVISSLGLNESYASIRSKLTVRNPSNSRFLEITIRDEDPKRAKLIADELAEVSSSFINEKMNQDPPEILQRGYTDNAPVSPNIGRNTVIGGFIGMLFAGALVVISYLLNDTIMGPDDVERKLGLQVLASLPLEEAVSDSGTPLESNGSKKKGKSGSKKKK